MAKWSVIQNTKKVKYAADCLDACNGNTPCEYWKWKVRLFQIFNIQCLHFIQDHKKVKKRTCFQMKVVFITKSGYVSGQKNCN